MVDQAKQSFSIEEAHTEVRPITLFLVLLGVIGGLYLLLTLLPGWISGYAQSIDSAQPKIFWYLARGSAIIAYFLLWFSMVYGVTVTNKLAAKWPGLAKTNELHQYVSILGLAFGLFHGLILLGDQYMNFSLWQVFLPFSTVSYRPLAVGLGQLAFYGWLVIVVSFYLIFISVLFHALIGGTDASLVWMQWIYWSTGGLLLFLTIYRIFHEVEHRREQKARALERQSTLFSA
jgi:predicted ferric reductase